MTVSQFNRAKEIMTSLEDLEKIRKNAKYNIWSSFNKIEKDNREYYGKEVELQLFPNSKDFTSKLQNELSDMIDKRCEFEKNKLNQELNEL